MSLIPPPKLQELQAALHAKAKASPNQRFHALYDKVYRGDILEHAYDCCRANGGAEGVDGQSFADIEKYGLGRWLGELAEELKVKRYRPSPVRRVWIPKPDGKKRPLGIPTIKDRVAQTAAMLVLQPIFEADLQGEQYAYRPQRSALHAVQHVCALLRQGHMQVVDADLSGYFDSIPHAELMQCLRRRIVDGAMLLSNLYMRRFVLGWKRMGHEARLKARIVNYADDFVICCRGTACQAATGMRDMMRRLKLTVNEGKTQVRELPGETFDFLGYTFGRHRSARTGRWMLCGKPSVKRIARVCEKISAMTGRNATLLSVEEMVAQLNPVLRGWAGYFCMGPISDAYRIINAHVRYRFRKWWTAKHKGARPDGRRHWSRWLEQEFGLLQLKWDASRLPQANA